MLFKYLKKLFCGQYSLFVLFWICSIAVCEYNTYKYVEIFRNVKIHDIGGEGYIDDDKVKVLKYTKDSAAVYSVLKNEFANAGTIYYFKRDNENNWKFDYYDTIWSKTGNADKYVWPYVR